MFLTDVPWAKFVARSALLLGLAGLALMAMFVAVLGVDPSDPYSELAAAARNPAAYRLSAFLDMLTWVGIGGVLLAFAGTFAARAPMRALLLAALGAGQVVGYLGGALRLGAISELGTRYAAAAPDQQAALGQIYLTLAQVTFTHYGAGQWLYGPGYLLIAWLAFSQAGVPRWVTVWFALMGLYAVANQLSFVALGSLLPGVFFLVFMLGQDLVSLALAITFWRGAAAPATRVAPAPVA
jgi:hypothetical protein